MTKAGLKRAARRRERIIWLVTNRSTWEGIDHRGVWGRPLFERMQKHGLFSKKSKWHDADMEGLTREARELVMMHWFSLHIYDRIIV